MKVAILGHGKEGQSSEKYFQRHGAEIKIFNNFTVDELQKFDLSNFDLILRSPSVRPLQDQTFSSQTKYFFAHCPAPIIGVTGTKGKGTTCSLIASILRACGETVHLVGNIGVPALDILDDIQPNDIVVYELSSFQLWDLQQSPHIAVILRLEPDHLDVHANYTEYLTAKANIAKYQTTQDFCIYFHDNPDTIQIAKNSPGTQISYPPDENLKNLKETLKSLTLIGPHNIENATAALTACAAYYQLPLPDFLKTRSDQITTGLNSFHGLPHRLEFVRELHNVKYYDDNFATNLPSTRAAINSFPNQPTILIAGGRDKTDNADLPDLAKLFEQAQNLQQVILIGESGHALAATYPSPKFTVAENLADAVTTAQQIAEQFSNSIVVMSPAAASFDMFTSYYDRGEQYQALVKGLK